MALKTEGKWSHSRSWIVGHFPPPSNIELHVACLWPGGNRTKSFEFEGATFHLIPCPSKGRALLLFQTDTRYFRPLFNQIRPDLVHGWGTEDSYGLVARRLEPKRHVIGIQGLIRNCYRYLPSNYRNLLVLVTEEITLRKARHLVAENCYTLGTAGALSPSAIKRVIEHPLRQEFLVSQPANGDSQTVLFVGTIHQSKGILDALDAFARVAPNSWKIHVVGSGSGKDETRMIELVRNSGLSDRFCHSRTLNAHDLAAAMRQSSVFLLPTRVDSGPTALKEALTVGLWPVCYDNSGPAEYIRKYGFGSLAKDQDIDSLCAELAHCLTDMPWKDTNKRTLLSGRTRNDFSREQAWERLIEFYRMVASAA